MEDYKKKYEEALENFKKIKAANKDNKELVNFIEYEYPELKENEDERIRNFLISKMKEVGNVWKEYSSKDIIAWLEKPGEKLDIANKEYWRGYREGKKEILDKYAELEKQGEQKPATDFSDLRTWKYIVDAVWTEKEGIGQYTDSPFTEEVAKKLQKRFGKIEQKPTDKVEPKFHEGDVIKPKNGGHEPWKIMQVDISDKKYRFKEGYVIHFSQENDYELVEQQPAWGEKDERIYKVVLGILNSWSEGTIGGKIIPPNTDRYVNWFKSLKGRVQPQPKQEWSEEDERLIEFLISHFSVCHPYRSFKFDINTDLTTDEIIERIRNLSSQSQWKPSDEQMEALYTYIYNPQYFNSPDPRMELVESVYKDLKKLREE